MIEQVTITIVTASGYRPTEMVADLRNAAETLFHPMKSVAYWDVPSRDHRCPQAMLGRPCPHVLPEGDPLRVEYHKTVEDLQGAVDVYFPHAEVHIYLG